MLVKLEDKSLSWKILYFTPNTEHEQTDRTDLQTDYNSIDFSADWRQPSLKYQPHLQF